LQLKFDGLKAYIQRVESRHLPFESQEAFDSFLMRNEKTRRWTPKKVRTGRKLARTCHLWSISGANGNQRSFRQELIPLEISYPFVDVSASALTRTNNHIRGQDKAGKLEEGEGDVRSAIPFYSGESRREHELDHAFVQEQCE
jgi:hypothetical protein